MANPKRSRKDSRAEEAALARRLELLMLDHIEQTLPRVRAFIKALGDDELLAHRGRSSGRLIDNPFGVFALREAGLAEASPAYAMLDALYPWHLRRVLAGELPVPEGRVMSCPNAGMRCTSADHALFSFDELREHVAACSASGRASGIALVDPFSHAPVRERQRPTRSAARDVAS